MSVVDDAQAALEKYKQDGIIPIPPALASGNDFAVWGVVFDGYPDVWKTFPIEENRRYAANSAHNYMGDENHNNSFLRISALLAMTNLKMYSEAPEKFSEIFREIQIAIFQVWIEAFDAIGCTKEFLIELRKYWELFGQSQTELSHGIITQLMVDHILGWEGQTIEIEE